MPSVRLALDQLMRGNPAAEAVVIDEVQKVPDLLPQTVLVTPGQRFVNGYKLKQCTSSKAEKAVQDPGTVLPISKSDFLRV